jgi:excisionase family DNA binding protein
MKLEKAFYSPTELGELIDLSSDTILNYIKANRIFAIKLSERTYRIPQRAVARFLGETVTLSHITKRAHGGRAAAAKLRRRMAAEERAAVTR